jgi:hypothetical protein
MPGLMDGDKNGAPRSEMERLQFKANEITDEV